MKKFSRHDSGFSTLSALIACFVIVMMISSVTLFLNNFLRLRKKVDDEIVEKKAMLSFIHNAILKSLNDDAEKQENSRFDEIWQYDGIENGRFVTEIINNSALLNINYLEEDMIYSPWFKKYICDEFDADGFMEDRNSGLFYSNEDYLKYFGTEYDARHFTLTSMVNINQCDRKVLEYLLEACFKDDNVSDYLVSKILLKGNKVILSEADFMMLAGIYYDDLSCHFTYLPQVNINFAGEELLSLVFMYLQIPGWQKKLEYILKLRQESIITEKKIKELFSEREYLKLFSWIGTRNFSYTIFLKGKNLDSRFVLMRNNLGNMFEIKEVSWECK